MNRRAPGRVLTRCLLAAIVGMAGPTLASPAAACAACDNAEELAAIYAGMIFSGMTEAQVAAAKLEARQAYHDRQMGLAKARFMSRFKLSDQPQSGASAKALKVD